MQMVDDLIGNSIYTDLKLKQLKMGAFGKH